MRRCILFFLGEKKLRIFALRNVVVFLDNWNSNPWKWCQVLQPFGMQLWRKDWNLQKRSAEAAMKSMAAAEFRTSHRHGEISFSMPRQIPKQNEYIPKESWEGWGSPRNLSSLCSSWNVRAVSGRSRKRAVCCKKVFSLLSLNGEEMDVFVAVFGEPEGVAGCNKRSHCHSSQMWTGCASWKEKTRETSKIFSSLPPPSPKPPTSFQCPPSSPSSFASLTNVMVLA